jgi:hypothetical protein
MGYEEREGLQPSHLLCYLLHPHVYTPLYCSTSVRDIPSYIPPSGHLMFSWRSVLAFLERLDRAFGGWPSASGFDARSSKASLMVWYESEWPSRLVHSMARACWEL